MNRDSISLGSLDETKINAVDSVMGFVTLIKTDLCNIYFVV